jgi:hypothetical protein
MNSGLLDAQFDVRLGEEQASARGWACQQDIVRGDIYQDGSTVLGILRPDQSSAPVSSCYTSMGHPIVQRNSILGPQFIACDRDWKGIRTEERQQTTSKATRPTDSQTKLIDCRTYLRLKRNGNIGFFVTSVNE